MSDVKGPLRVLTLVLTMIMIITTVLGPGLLPVSPFCAIRIVIIDGERRVCLARVWAMML